MSISANTKLRMVCYGNHGGTFIMYGDETNATPEDFHKFADRLLEAPAVYKRITIHDGNKVIYVGTTHTKAWDPNGLPR